MFLLIKKDITKINPLVFLIFALATLFILTPAFVEAATLSISPATGAFEVGERVPIRVVVNSSGAPFNAVSGLISVPSIFSIDSVSKTSSVLNFWVTEPTISSSSRTVKFEGIALGGFTGSTGTAVTINLRAKASGSGQVSINSGQILANDGEGTDITGNLIGANFSVKDAAPKPEVELPEPEIEVPQPLPTLKAPEIMLGTKYGAQAILGTSDYPEVQTLITFIGPDGSKVFILGNSDEDGSFGVLIPNSLKRGKYSVTAVMIKEDKTNSNVSNMIIIKVGNLFSDIGWEIWLLITLLILAIVYLILRAHVHLVVNGDLANKKKLREAQEVVHKSFGILREDIAEHKKPSEFKEDVAEAEKVIEKKIKDIE